MASQPPRASTATWARVGMACSVEVNLACSFTRRAREA